MSIFRSIAGNATERRLLPDRRRGATAYIIAIMTFAMMVSAAAGLALANASATVAEAARHRFVAQLADSDPAAVAAAVATVRGIEGVEDVEPVPREEMRRTLEQWLGPAADAADLPLPALVYFDATPEAAQRARALLPRAAPGAEVLAESAQLEPFLRPLRALQWTALALVLLMAVAASAAVVLAARGALEAHRSTIEIMHGIGATDEQMARLFQRKIALDAALGALGGAVASTLALALIAGGTGSLAGITAGRPPLGLADLAAIAAIPVTATLLATIVARAAVLRALRNR